MKRYLALAATAAVSFSAITALCCPLAAHAAGEHDITGKVMGVFHEPVKINNQWMDKVSLTIRPCNPSAGQTMATYEYVPSAVKDEAVAGHLFNQGAISARHMEQKNQYMQSINGHVTLKVNDQDQILKTTYWGYNYECGHNVDSASAVTGTSTGTGTQSNVQGNTTKTPAATPSTTPQRGPSFRFGKFGVDL